MQVTLDEFAASYATICNGLINLRGSERAFPWKI